MDSLTHALIAAFIASGLHLPQAIPFMVLGAVIIDADLLWPRLSDRDPSLYLFTHGGILHSLCGTVAIACIAWAAAAGLLASGLERADIPVIAPSVAFSAVLGGALIHTILDTLALPGLPLLAPFSDRKFTAGLFPGPSISLMAASLFFLVWLGLGAIDLPALVLPYAAVIGMYCTVRLASFAGARHALSGKARAIPRISPFRWLVVEETPDAWMVRDYRFGRGFGDAETIPKFLRTDAGEVAPFLQLPEVRRFRFYSYIVAARRDGDTVVFSDPLRISGRIRYPPHFTSVKVSLAGQTGA